jgi:hypothetical protein
MWGLSLSLSLSLSLTRGRVCRLKLPLALASAVILGSESRWTRDHISLSDTRLPFSSPPTTRRVTVEVFDPASTRESPPFITRGEPNRDHHLVQFVYYCVPIRCHEYVF